MTPRQVYRELIKLSKLKGKDGLPLLLTKKVSVEFLGNLSNGLMCLFEKLDADRAREDLDYYYRTLGRRRPSRRGMTVSIDDLLVSEEGSLSNRRGYVSTGVHPLTTQDIETLQRAAERPVRLMGENDERVDSDGNPQMRRTPRVDPEILGVMEQVVPEMTEEAHRLSREIQEQMRLSAQLRDAQTLRYNPNPWEPMPFDPVNTPWHMSYSSSDMMMNQAPPPSGLQPIRPEDCASIPNDCPPPGLDPDGIFENLDDEE